jgi:glycosyl transferase family 87
VKTGIFLVFLAFLVFLLYPHSANLKATDFPDFYCASRMVMQGHGHELYDVELQRRFQIRCAGRVGTLYIHPPFETVLYLVVAWLQLRSAYLLWCLLNLGCLALGVYIIARNTLPDWDWRYLLAVSFAFVPILLSFLQGQDSIVLLLLATLAFAAIRGKRHFAAGCWLGLALFKFQLALPLFLILGLQKGGTRLLRGFAFVALPMAILSAAIGGWSVFTQYPKLLLHLEQAPINGVFPTVMANFRGLVAFFFQTDSSRLAMVLVLALSVATLLLALRGYRSARRAGADAVNIQANILVDQNDLAFGNLILFALLVSYHLNPHDLSLLLLPLLALGGTLRTERHRMSLALWLAAGLSAILFLPPLHLLALRAHAYALVALPIFALFLAVTCLLHSEERTSSSA